MLAAATRSEICIQLDYRYTENVSKEENSTSSKMIEILRYNTRKSKWKHNISIALVFMAMLSVLSSCNFVKNEKHNILVVLSNEPTYHPYERYGKALKKALADEGVKANIEYFYLDCERYNEDDEISRLDSVANSYHGRKLDLIIVNGDQATYSLLSTHNALLTKTPIVFGAVRYPNRKLLSQYAPYGNITGLHDSIDVVKNMQFVKELTNRRHVICQFDDTYLDRQTMAMVDSQLARRPNILNNIHWKYPLTYIRKQKENILSITSMSLRHTERMASDVEVLWRRKDKTVATCGDDADRKVIGAQNYFLMTSRYSDGFCYLSLKNEVSSRISIGMYSGFVFTSIDESFDMGEMSKIIGGYFTTWETTATEEAKISKKILIDNVKPCDIAIYVPKKEYVVDWNAHNDKTNLELYKDLPSYVTIMNMPFNERHPVAYIAMIHGAIALVLFLLVFYYIQFHSEQTKRRQAYERLKEEEENLKLAIQGSKTYAWMIKNGRATMAKAFFEDMNRPVRSWVLSQGYDLWFVLPKYHDGLRNFFASQGEIGSHTYQFETDFGDGATRWWEIRSTTLSDDDGHIYTVGLLIDIRNIKQHESELEEARKKAIEGERLAEEARRLSKEAELKHSFLANMSHEIRTPLNAIVGFSTLIASDEESLTADEKAMFIKEINNNTDLLLRLINDILDLSRIESGKMEFNFKNVPVNTLLDDTYNATRLQMPKNLEYIEMKCDSNPSVYVDEGRFQQVLSNFITNARKFTSEGYVKLGCTLDTKTSEVEFFVEDTGIGLTPAEQKLVFDRFYKADSYQQGTGLGLSISKVIVEKLNGRLGLKSEKGKGSRFSVFIKVAQL